MNNEERPIIIKKIKKGGHGHHGGAWKVAYADFVTAMMAFFLMLWLINTTTPEQKRGIADYFAVASLSESKSGAGGVMGGQSFDSDGARRSGSSSIVQSQSQPQPSGAKQKSGESKGKKTANSGGSSGEKGSAGDSKINDEVLDKALAEREQRMFEKAAQSLRQAIEDLPELAELSKNLIIDQTPEGLRIQIIDQEGRPMFLPGQEKPIPRAEKLIEAVAKIIDRLPNRITISGHTDSVPFVRADGYSNWELSAGRANSSRQVLQRAGVKNDRLYQVSGKAGSEPLFPDDPYLVGNRRISIVLLREAPVLPASWR